MNFDEIIGKVKDGAAVAAEVAGQAFDGAKKTVNKSLDVAALSAKIKRLKISLANEYMAIGKLVHQAHRDPDTNQHGLDDMLETIDGLQEELEAVIEERDRRKAE